MNRITLWKNWLLTLPDQPFFNLMRNYLGNLQTPFNKHSLIEELSVFLGREEIQDRMLASLDDLDRQILSIVFLLDSCTEAPVLDMLRLSRTSWEIRQRLINLQERLFLYRTSHGVYHPVPHLEELLRDRAIHTDHLFPGTPGPVPAAPPPWLNDGFLAAFLSFISHYAPAVRNGGGLARRSLSELRRCFPLFDADPEKPEPLLHALEAGGFLLQGEDKILTVNLPRWNGLLELPEEKRILYLYSRTVLDPRRLSTPWRSADGEKLVSGLLAALPPDVYYTEETLIRLCQLILPDRRPSREDLKVILDNLILLDLILETPSGLCRNPGAGAPADPAGELSIHPNLEITVPPHPDLKRIFPLAFYCRIHRFEQVGLYHLDQESCFQGLHRGRSLPEPEVLLDGLSRHDLPQNIRFSLNHWIQQFRSVRLLQGIVLKVSSDRIPLIEKNPQMTGFIRETLAPGVYLLDPLEKPAWESCLRSAGILVTPPVETPATEEESRILPVREPELWTPLRLLPGKPAPASPPEDLRKELQDQLRKASLSPEEKEEMAERIDKKVILFSSQLLQSPSPREVREASGLDYPGKIRLIEEALASGREYLEISWFTPEDEIRTDLIIPRHLSKEEPDLILSGPWLEDPAGKDFRIRVRKISQLKRRKLSFFALT